MSESEVQIYDRTPLAYVITTLASREQDVGMVMGHGR